MKPETLQAMKWYVDGEAVQYRNPDCGWFDIENPNYGIGGSPRFYDNYEYRIKPRIIKIGDMEVPAPETEAPDDGVRYYFFSSYGSEITDNVCWRGDAMDIRMLKHGLVHLTEEAATAHARALIAISGGRND